MAIGCLNFFIHLPPGKVSLAYCNGSTFASNAAPRVQLHQVNGFLLLRISTGRAWFLKQLHMGVCESFYQLRNDL